MSLVLMFMIFINFIVSSVSIFTYYYYNYTTITTIITSLLLVITKVNNQIIMGKKCYVNNLAMSAYIFMNMSFNILDKQKYAPTTVEVVTLKVTSPTPDATAVPKLPVATYNNMIGQADPDHTIVPVGQQFDASQYGVGSAGTTTFE